MDELEITLVLRYRVPENGLREYGFQWWQCAETFCRHFPFIPS